MIAETKLARESSQSQSCEQIHLYRLSLTIYSQFVRSTLQSLPQLSLRGWIDQYCRNCLKNEDFGKIFKNDLMKLMKIMMILHTDCIGPAGSGCLLG